jgi:glucose/arabinose dehydrogenase
LTGAAHPTDRPKPVGGSCNICEPDADRDPNIMRRNADGSGLETFARGVRNTGGFD